MVMVVAHRGASVSHRENTVEAFEEARIQGAAGIEFDVRRSADNVLVVHHDAHLADGRLIADVPADELPEWVPTLAQVLDVSSDMWLNLEIKNLREERGYDDTGVIPLAVAGVIAAHLQARITAADDQSIELAELYRDRLLVSSFDVDNLSRMRSVEPAIPVGLLVWGQVDPASIIARVEAHGFDAVNPHDLLVDQAFVERAHDADLTVNVWTVDDPARIVELAEMKVDGIITNDPATAIGALRRVDLA